MGGFNPVSTMISTGMQVLQAGGQQKAANQQAAAADQAAADQYENEARKRRSLLDREMASARARLGAMGIGGSGGSAAAVLEGLQQRSEEDIAELRGDLDRRSTKNAARPASGGSAPGAAQIGLHILRPFVG